MFDVFLPSGHGWQQRVDDDKVAFTVHQIERLGTEAETLAHFFSAIKECSDLVIQTRAEFDICGHRSMFNVFFLPPCGLYAVDCADNEWVAKAEYDPNCEQLPFG